MSSITMQETSRSQLRSVALPVEHGGWAFWLEPALLGLLVAPSAAGLLLALSGLAVFLLHQPVKTALKDRMSKRRYQRTALAERVAIVYMLVALATFVLALATAAHSFLLPLALAVPFALIQLGYEAAKRGRDAVPEISGAVALGALAPAIAMANGWTLPAALGLWLIIAARAATSILYVRARLRLEKGKPVSPRLALSVHLIAFIGLAALAWARFLPWLVVVAAVLWLGYAAHGLSPFRQAVRPRTIGFQEIALGLLTVVLSAVGYTTL